MSETLQVLGAIAAALLAACGLLAPTRRQRAAALALALAAAFGVVLGQAWHGPLDQLRSEPAELAGLAALGLAALAALVAGFRRWPAAIPLTALATLPIRIPVELGGETSNLLVPLYVVIGAAVVVSLLAAAEGPRGTSLPVWRPLAGILAAAVALYALQSAYSNDIEFAARNIAFFLVPFAALFVVLAETEWTPRLLVAGLGVVAGEAALFALVGIVQHQAGEIFWNDALESSNDFHFYFRSNSVFFDPNIYGRYLSLAIVLLVAALLWTRDARRAAAIAAGVALIWAGLVFGFSQTSFLALLAGLAVLCALRWSLRWTLVATPVVVIAVLAAVLVNASDEGPRSEEENATSGHSTLVEGGLELAGNRPLQGYGSGSFPIAFREQVEGVGPDETTVSHNEPVTVAAEQGAVGVAVYAATVVLALWTLFGGMRAISPGLGGRLDSSTDEGRLDVARMAAAAGFCALLVHTIGYAGYLTDPLTWSLLAIGAALAAGSAPKRA